MTGNKNPEKDPLEEHEILKNLIKDPTSPPKATLLLGYVGKTGSNDSIRLYLNMEFDEYIDIQKNLILYARHAPEEVIQFGGTYIWVSKEAKITRTRVSTKSEPSKLLQGDIIQKFGRASDFESELIARREQLERRSEELLCPSKTLDCESREIDCLEPPPLSRPRWECEPPRPPPSRPRWECEPPRPPPSRPRWECEPDPEPTSRQGWVCDPPPRPPSRPRWTCD